MKSFTLNTSKYLHDRIQYLIQNIPPRGSLAVSRNLIFSTITPLDCNLLKAIASILSTYTFIIAKANYTLDTLLNQLVDYVSKKKDKTPKITHPEQACFQGHMVKLIRNTRFYHQGG